VKKTSVYLTPKEYAALQRAARITHRTQSDLIREGVRRVSMGVKLPGMKEPINAGIDWFTREEEIASTLKKIGRPISSIARELRVSEQEARAILDRHAARWKRMWGDPPPDIA
jgi:Ribbon-helix-helix protein, copG family